MNVLEGSSYFVEGNYLVFSIRHYIKDNDYEVYINIPGSVNLKVTLILIVEKVEVMDYLDIEGKDQLICFVNFEDYNDFVNSFVLSFIDKSKVDKN